MKVTFRKRTKVKDVIAYYDTDKDWAEAISRNLESWEDVTDPDTDEEMPMPEPGSIDWYKELDQDDWQELTNLWQEWRSRSLPKTSDTTL